MVSVNTRNILLFIASCFPIFFACSNKSSPVDPPTPVDTLATGWKKIAIPASGFNDIFFINNNTGYVAGSSIYRSTDGGNNWQKVYEPSSPISNIAMGSESNSVFISGGSQIVLTRNGGTSFDIVTINDAISDAFFVNATTVYAVGAKFWKSTDAGSTWTKISDIATGGGYQSLHFLNDQYGWMAGFGGPYKTINGGIMWEQKINPNFSFSSGNAFFTDVNNGYISDGLIVGKTSNGGNSWSRVYTGTSSYQDLHFISTNTGYVADGSYIYKTEDGGNTWNKVVALAQDGMIELHFTDASHGWACGSGVLKYQN